jgi:hypothetical protein
MNDNRSQSLTLMLCVLMIGAFASVAAQQVDPPAGEPDRLQEREMLRQQIRDRIDADPGLGAAERERMQQNLRNCLQLELGDDQVEGLFPISGHKNGISANELIQLQDRVITAADAGLAADLLADKVREGRMKQVDPGAMNRVMDRLEQNLRFAHRVMTQAAADGVTPAGDAVAERQMQRGMAMNMWRGLQEDDVEHLRERARLRLQDGQCSTVELAAAAETTTEFLEAGVERQRSREIVGTGLEQGYGAREIRQMGQMVRVSAQRGGPDDAMLQSLERHLRSRDNMQAMERQMLHHGWLGPRDMAGPGGHSPVDNVIDGPGRHGSPQDGGSGPGGPGGSGGQGGQGGNGGQQGQH